MPCATSSRTRIFQPQPISAGLGLSPDGSHKEAQGGPRPPAAFASPGPRRPSGGSAGSAAMPAGWRWLEEGPLPSDASGVKVAGRGTTAILMTQHGLAPRLPGHAARRGRRGGSDPGRAGPPAPRSPQPSLAESLAGTDQERDPRSPTPGISRTPMRAVSSDSVDRLVKQLSEAFGAEAAAPEPAPPGPGAPLWEPSRYQTEIVFSLYSEPRVSKPIRPKPNNKFMATPGGTGRSPLSILRDDNSPSAPAPRQGKRHVLGENLGEKKDVDLSRSLKSGNCAWSDLNKENQQCPFVEN
ncbi:PREDICTED: cell division cycle-associated protein 3 [Ficedula albicollis]|uniref:cell division cycle-associated protein 3 n=1 Tax=Ficedula albicollis TaxID=59894 RepID=UPI0007AD9537|nr:PREDICTED: cell division cycle-associated protein 3 [Ficedula albicollis]